jgi:predicted AAA+ superfamily ATPase
MIDITSFQLQNPWRSGKFIPEKSLRRNLLSDVLSWLDDPDILVVIGSRQVGKTTLLFQVIEQLIATGLSAHDLFYFNLDDPILLESLETPAEFLNFIEFNQKDRAYVFIDEVQRLENPGLFLKYIYDLKRNLKLIVTGSSSLEIRSKISESLTGRKKLFHLYPFDFVKFVAAKWKEFSEISSKMKTSKIGDFLAMLSEFNAVYHPTINKFLAEYFTYGGYPRVVLEPNPQRKIIHLKEIFTSYMQKDVKDFFKIENTTGYNNLIKVLSQQIGNLVNISELSNTLGLHKSTIEKYLNVLEGTFMFQRLTPFFQNVRREISKMPKIYAMDLGMRNFAAGNFNEIALRDDRGVMAENFVFAELTRLIEVPGDIHFWRTQTKAEVDLIIELPDQIIPTEVKFTTMKSPRLSRSFRSFLVKYRPQWGLVFTRDYIGQTQENETQILFLPLWSVLFNNLNPELNL